MATLYADRAFIQVNGVRVQDVQSASLRQNMNARPVPTMTPDSFNRGIVQGNRDIDITVAVAVQNTLSRPKLEGLPFTTADVALVFIVGADQYVAKSLFMKDVEDNAGGIGDEVKSTFNMGALRLTDAVGNSALFDIQF